MPYSVSGLAEMWNCQSLLFTSLDSNALIHNHGNGTVIKQAILKMPVIQETRLKSCAGKAFLWHPKYGPHIKLHPALFDNTDYVSNDRLDTFFHEIAHHIAYLTSRHNGHGLPWSYSMQHFGFNPVRYYEAEKFNYRGYKNRKEQREHVSIINELEDLGL